MRGRGNQREGEEENEIRGNQIRLMLLDFIHSFSGFSPLLLSCSNTHSSSHSQFMGLITGFRGTIR